MHRSPSSSLFISQGHTEAVTSVSFSPKGDFIVSGSHDNTVKVWSTLDGTCTSTLEVRDSYAYCFALPLAWLYERMREGEGEIDRGDDQFRT